MAVTVETKNAKPADKAPPELTDFTEFCCQDELISGRDQCRVPLGQRYVVLQLQRGNPQKFARLCPMHGGMVPIEAIPTPVSKSSRFLEGLIVGAVAAYSPWWIPIVWRLFH